MEEVLSINNILRASESSGKRSRNGSVSSTELEGIFAPLYEHFLVIGADPAKAIELGNHIRKSKNLSSKFMSRIGSMLQGRPSLDPASPGGDKKALAANATSSTSEPHILYRFPPVEDAPPGEICDFCLPTGAKLELLSQINSSNETVINSINEMLYGHEFRRTNRLLSYLHVT